MKQKSAAIALLLFACHAGAQPFVEFGVGTYTGGCIYHYDRNKPDERCSPNPLGAFVLGVKLPHGFTLQWDHWSSLDTSKDRGVDIVSVR